MATFGVAQGLDEIKVSFRKGAGLVGLLDLVFGCVLMIEFKRFFTSYIAEGKKVPLFGMYVEKGESYWFTSPDYLDYSSLPLGEDPFRMQYFVIIFMIVPVCIILFSLILLLGVLKERRCMIRCWTLPNYCMLIILYPVILSVVYNDYGYYFITYSVPILCFRAAQVWIVNTYQCCLIQEH